MPAPGTLVLDEYQLEEFIGEGAWSRIGRARSIADGQQYAIKILKLPEELRAFTPERFVREFHALRRLRAHPHILSVYRLGRWKNWTLFSMELVQGPTLGEHFCGIDPGSMSGSRYAEHINQVFGLFEQLLDALHFIHSQRIVHRDLKPGNLMVDEKGQIRVMDFGLAKDLSATSISSGHSVMGTLPYLSPEQINGGEVDARTDLYATGCILYELLTGERPLQGEHPVRLMYSILEQRPRDPRELAPHMPDALGRLCLKLIEKDPRQRPPSAKSLLTDLLRIQGESEEWITSTTVLMVDEVIYYVPPFLQNAANLAALRRWRNAAIEGEGRTVAVVGESGVGKTRLVGEFRRALGPDVPLIQAVCPAKPEPLQPIVELVRGLVRYMDQAQAGWDERAPEPLLVELAALHPELADRFNAASAMTQILDGSEEQRRIEAICSVVRLAAEGLPLVLLLESADLADPQSQEAIRQLAAQLRAAPVLLLLVLRAPDRRTADALLEELAAAGCLDDRLRPELLTPEGTHQFICGLLSREDVPQRFSSEIHDWAAGNPYFTRELVVGVLSGAKTSEVADRMRRARIDVPESIREAVEARARPLTEPARAAAHCAALLGRGFSAAELGAVLECDSETLQHLLQELLLARLIEPDAESGAACWRFVHPIHAQALVAASPRQVRRALHRRIALVLQEEGDPSPLRIARHWSRAGAPELAAGPALVAAREAIGCGQVEQAVECYELAEGGREGLSPAEQSEVEQGLLEALRLACRHEQHLDRLQAQEDGLVHPGGEAGRLFEVLRRQAGALAALGRSGEARIVLERAELAVHEGDAVAGAWIDLDLASLMLHSGDRKRSLDRVARALERVRALEDPWQLTRLAEQPRLEPLQRVLQRVSDAGLRCALALHMGSFFGMPALLESVIAEQPEDHRLLAPARAGLGAIAQHQGRFDEALQHHQAALELALRHGTIDEQAASHLALGELAFSAGSIATAQHHLRQALSVYQRGGPLAGMASAWELQCEIWFELESLDRIERTLGRALEHSSELPAIHQGRLVLLAGRLALVKLNPRRADEHFLRAERIFSGCDAWEAMCRACYHRAQGLLESGDLKQAATLAGGLDFSCQEKQYARLLVDVRRLVVQILLDEEADSSGDVEQAYRRAEEALLAFPDPHKAWRLYHLGVQLYGASDPGRARALYRQAREALDRIASDLTDEDRRAFFDEAEKAALLDLEEQYP